MLSYEMKHALEMLQQLRRSDYDGVPGVMKIDSARPGPTLGITVNTHGNEPGGLMLFHYLLRVWRIEERLQRGTLLLVINNLQAADRYFALEQELPEDDPTRDATLMRCSRYVSVNLNRLPENVLERSPEESYEIKRVHELLPVWQQFDVGFDIHSTTVPMTPMLVSRGNTLPLHLIREFPVDVILSNIDEAQLGIPAFSLYGKDRRAPVFAIEAGQHTSGEAVATVVVSTLSLLRQLQMITGESTASTPVQHHEYVIADRLMFPDIEYDFVSDFQSGHTVKQGDLLAASSNGAPPITAPFDGHLIMPTKYRGAEKDISEEVAFLSLPVRTYGK